MGCTLIMESGLRVFFFFCGIAHHLPATALNEWTVDKHTVKGFINDENAVHKMIGR